MTRILISGSRTWRNAWAVHEAIANYLRTVGKWDEENGMPSGDVVIVHGACPKGADRIADEWAINACLAPERHPAQWRLKGRSAGHLRNADMVKAGADVHLSFVNSCTSETCRLPRPHDSHGAAGCIALSERAGIPTRVTREYAR